MPGRSGFVLAPLISAADTKYRPAAFTGSAARPSSNFVLFIATPVEYQELRRPQERQAPDHHRGLRLHHRQFGHAECFASTDLPDQGVRAIRASSMHCSRSSARGRWRVLPACEHSGRHAGIGLRGAVLRSFDMEPNLPILDRYISTRRRGAARASERAQRLGLAVIAPPGLPDDLTRILRQSYLKMVESRRVCGGGHQAQP